MMRARTGFHRDDAIRLRREEPQHLGPRQLAPEYNRSIGGGSVRLEDRLRQIEPDDANLVHGRHPRCGSFDTAPWHVDAVGGRPPHRLQSATSATPNISKSYACRLALLAPEILDAILWGRDGSGGEAGAWPLSIRLLVDDPWMASICAEAIR
jgi:hypothetical protein